MLRSCSGGAFYGSYQLRYYHISREKCHDFGKSNALIGHWRKTTISYTGPIDEHLVLHVDGTVENWTATAYERREPVTGHWSVEGKTLTLSFGGNDRSSPFTFYQGQLVFPNIQNRRGIWEKIE